MNIYGKESLLKIETQVKHNKTVLKNTFFSAPLKIAKPFYDMQFNMMKLCMLNVSPGILSGDSYKIDINLGESSKLELYTQSYSKVFNMKEGFAKQKLNINLEKGAVLEYMPLPIIPYTNSNYTAINTITLKKTSTLFFRDIISCGRYKRNEVFQFQKFKSRTEIYLEDELIFVDNTFLNPEIQKLNEIGFYEGYTHQANVIVFNYNVDEQLKDYIVEFLNTYDDIDFGATITCDSCMIIKILGKGSEKLKIITNNLKQNVRMLIK
ncbi:urease accessory protein UreD [Clostridium tyrobutyricum]|uniref:urease accessory protein UreD n=1 Tax=Clostridium tyrobutyricum TaxID=1519 RepID=UPI000580737D|nr:urease accessory protein UreD [Clostridium tyrobutyricum]